MHRFLTFSTVILLGATTACTNSSNDFDPTSLDSTALSAISEETYRQYVADLASDEFMGRRPFTKGDTLTVNYIEEQFKNLGLKPGNGSSYFQEVPMVEIEAKPTSTTWTFKGSKGEVKANYLDEFVVTSPSLEEHIQLDDTELVFVGFGIIAPEFGWNDYEGIDVKGKTVVAMVSDPGRYDKDLFKADTMTYYGRWKYKNEEAARQGAAGVILIHETGAASYGWNVVRNGWTGPQLELIPEEGAQNILFQGWVTTDIANKLFEISDLGADAMEAAKKPGFKASPMGISTSVGLTIETRTSKSNNVIAKIEGSKRPDEVIIYTAHWDHLEIGRAHV